MTLKNHTITLRELVFNVATYRKLYMGVTDFDRVVQIQEQVITPIDKIIQAHDKALEAFRKRKDDKVEDEYQEMLNKEVTFKMAVLGKDDVRTVGLNPLEMHYLRDFIK